MNKILAALLVLFGLVDFAMAQDSSEKPVAPFLAKLPAETCWKMDFTPSSAGHAPSTANASFTPTPTAVKKQFVMTRIGGMRRDLTTWSDGTMTDAWLVKGAAFLKEPKITHYTAYMPQDNPYGADYPDFPDLAWVNLDHFKGVEMKNGQKCLVYATEQRNAPFPYKSPYPNTSDIKLGSATIWISIHTKLPVAWQDESNTAVYTFGLAPETQTLPAECQTVVQSIDDYNKRIAGKKMVLPP